MKRATKGRFVVGIGLCLGALILAGYGLKGPILVAALACIFASVWLAKQLRLTHAADQATDYELNLLARLDDPNPTVHKQAEMEKELHNWQKIHKSTGAGDAGSKS